MKVQFSYEKKNNNDNKFTESWNDRYFFYFGCARLRNHVKNQYKMRETEQNEKKKKMNNNVTLKFIHINLGLKLYNWGWKTAWIFYVLTSFCSDQPAAKPKHQNHTIINETLAIGQTKRKIYVKIKTFWFLFYLFFFVLDSLWMLR